MTPARRRAGMARWAIVGVGGFVFVLFAAVLWYAYVEVMGLGAGGPPPLIRAELGPIKRAPGDPGGMPVANQGSPAVRVLEDEREPVRVERILPRQEVPPIPLDAEEVEEPLVVATPPAAVEPLAAPPVEEPATAAPVPTAATPPTTAAGAASEPPATPAEALVAREPPARAPAPPRAAEAPPPPAQQATPRAPAQQTTPRAPAQQATPRAPAQQATPRAPAQQATPRAPARSAPVAGPTYRVQLGAFRSDRAANAAWQQLQRQLGAALDGLRPNVVEAETSDGTFYRLQAGPLPGRDDAVRACDSVKRAGGDCFIVGPLP